MHKAFCRAILALSLMLPAPYAAWADTPEGGKVYKLNSGRNAATFLTYTGSGDMTVSAADASDPASQLWLVESKGSDYYLRSVKTGDYVYSTHNNIGKQYWYAWGGNNGRNLMRFTAQGDGTYAICATVDSPEFSMHCANHNHAVGWRAEDVSSHWTFTEVTDVTLPAWSEPLLPEAGKVYTISNSAQSGRLLTQTENDMRADEAADNYDRQLWYCMKDAGGYYFRNLATGLYLCSTGNINGNDHWYVQNGRNASSQMALPRYGEGYAVHAAADAENIAMHANGSHVIVGWDAAKNANSVWLFNEVAVSDLDDRLAAMTAEEMWPEAGNVYQIVNMAYATRHLRDGGSGVTAEADDAGSLWLTEQGPDGLYFRNLTTGRYLQSAGANYTQWATVSDASAARTQFKIIAKRFTDSEYRGIHANGMSATSMLLHCESGGSAVCWNNSSDASFWKFEPIEMTAGEIADALVRAHELINAPQHAADYQTALEALFTDKSCTVLKEGIDIDTDANYQALPATLQEMVRKVLATDWEETAGTRMTWDTDHARKYRVQLYEPYSEAWGISSMVGIGAYSNMNNPTGIVTDAGDVLYVMVEGEIKEGAELYLRGVTDVNIHANQAYRDGTRLHEGLNVIPCFNNVEMQYVYYVINNVTDGQPIEGRELSVYDDIKIHIEGGKVNGFFSTVSDGLYTADTNDDWLYIRDRAVHPMIDITGKYFILHFFFQDAYYYPNDTHPSAGLKNLFTASNRDSWDLPASTEIIDLMCYSEQLIMGMRPDDDVANNPATIVHQASDANGGTVSVNPYESITDDEILARNGALTAEVGLYFNNKMMCRTFTGNHYMSGTPWATNYNGSTMNAIITEIVSSPGSIWGPAHEFGHVNQGPINMAGTTEESNNVFSNVAVFYDGRATSRCDVPSIGLELFNNGAHFLEHGTWGTTRMFFQLWLYYHYCGYNKKFYPRLYRLLRKYPLQKPQQLNERYDQLHFVKMCCEAAQEDLTPFFEAWGFFTPMDNVTIGDYSTYYATLTREDIDAVKAEIKEMDYPVNYQIINIDDRPGSYRASWTNAASQSKDNAGSLGGLADFMKGSGTAPEGTLTYTLADGHMSVDHSAGSAGTGFVIVGQDGRVLGFSNDYSFPISSEAQQALIDGTASLRAVGADGSTLDAEIDCSSSLAALIEDADALNIDDNNTRVGYLKGSELDGFRAALADARAITGESTNAEVQAAYTALADIMIDIHNRPEIYYVQVTDGATYMLVHNQNNARALADATGSSQRASNGDTAHLTSYGNIAEGRWVFEAGTTAGRYRLRNVNSGKYLAVSSDVVNTSDRHSALVEADQAAEFAIQHYANDPVGVYVLKANGEDSRQLHISNGGANQPVIFCGGNWSGSKWQIYLKQTAEDNEARAELEELHARALALLETAADISEPEPVILTAENLSCNAPYTGSNANDRFTSYSVLTDGDYSTYFHSDYVSADALPHHLTVDLGSESAVSFSLTWHTRQNNNCAAPTNVTVLCSNDGANFTPLGSVSSGLATANNADQTIGMFTCTEPSRYIRMIVNTSSASNGNYFVLSEFGMLRHGFSAKSIYPDVTDVLLDNQSCANANAVQTLSADTSRAADYAAATSRLRAAYDALESAMTGATRITDTETADSDGHDTVHDLRGLRLNRVSAPGIYIINGRKVMVK